jgi:hypothetical protein
VKPPKTFHIDIEIDCDCGGKVGANQQGALVHTLPTCKDYDDVDVNETEQTVELLRRVRLKLEAAKQN